MKQSFYIVLFLVLANIVSCSKQDIPEIEKEKPIPEKPVPPVPSDSNQTVDCALWDGILRLYVVDKDSNDIVDSNYPQTLTPEKGRIYVKNAYYAEDHPFKLDSIDVQAPQASGDCLNLVLGFGFQYDRFFKETKDSLHLGTLYIPILEYYTKVGVEWTNGDIDTFTLRLTSACVFCVDKIIYKDSTFENGSACLIKEVQ